MGWVRRSMLSLRCPAHLIVRRVLYVHIHTEKKFQLITILIKLMGSDVWKERIVRRIDQRIRDLPSQQRGHHVSALWNRKVRPQLTVLLNPN